MLKNRKGQGMVEYVLIIFLVVVVVIACVKLFGNQVRDLFTSSTQQISSETGVSARK